MAPIGNDAVQSLQEMVKKLESRVQELEDQLQHFSGGPAPSPTHSVRMVLMGPPGAGMDLPFSIV